MNKALFLFSLLLICTVSISDKEILQQTLNGLFEQNKLKDPTTIVPCIDDATAHNIVVFAGQILEKAAKGSVSDILSIIQLIKNFGDQIPQPVKDCLDGNEEFKALGLKYGIDDTTDPSAIEKKVITYVTLHYLTVHKWLGGLNDSWKAGKYYQVGFDGATYGHSVLGEVAIPQATDKEIIQQVLNGLFEQNKLKDPTTIVPCIDDATAHNIVVFAGQILEKAAKGSVTDIISIIQLIKNFGDQIPQSVKDCLDGNEEFKALGLKYGIDDTTDTSVIEKKVIAYVTLHYLTVHKWLGGLNDAWKAGKYYQVGFDGATYGHSILGEVAIPEASDKDTIQQLLNGLFQSNKLPAPTTIVPCLDDATAHNIVVFIGQLLEKAAKGSISDLLSLKDLIQKFGDSIPQPVKDCLDGNEEFKALGEKYGITDTTDKSALEKKIIAYITLHYLSVHKTLGKLNDLWKAGKPYEVGQEAAAFGHSILSITEEEVQRMILA